MVSRGSSACCASSRSPTAPRAEEFFASGRYLWNGGIFAFRGDTLLALVERHLPALAQGLAAIAREPRRLPELYRTLPAISIDHGVMEKLDDLATLPLDCGWSDLGSWEALAEVLPRDRDGNSTQGDVVAVGCQRQPAVGRGGHGDRRRPRRHGGGAHRRRRAW